ncbi:MULTISPECIES: type I secretion system permease/ATPase [unclassified Neisseria]|uniref:type I secretion system permease/ATPase n=1 Tax=unclassified Neisseria TaxID=2623750 RepID=UPI0026669242|nr:MULTISPECIES: type I secretion system permease/ATPase [unclassified Neisseria]MDO1510534.1 type I secretion system permease/ATPase [Neisseria sp. MVDL19-042950]MDO1516327.1 type I secretion system permease/ATPase [Neisseria sp. MVDL18-041461]MDO1564127.1 type I secretion system permease/ATPase [Neisseria sp. MVDL20-010259]
MKSIIEHIALATRLLGAPVSEAALSAEVVRDKKLNVNFHSLTEVLRSHGFENTLSKRNLEDIPSLAVPVVIILHNEEAAVITKIEGSGRERKYHVRQADGLAQELGQEQLSILYLGYCWFIKPKMVSDTRSELPEYHLPKSWFWKVIWRFRSYYYQVILATFIINFLALVSSLYVMNVYDRVIPNQAYETLWVLSIGVILAITFEFAAKMIRGHLTDIAGKKADLIISSALFRRVMALRLADRPASSGSYANNLREFEAVREFMTSASLLTLVDLPFLLLFITVIGIVGGKLALVPLTIIPIVVVVGLLVQRPLSRHINESMKESSQRSGLAVEAIEGIETLKTNNATTWAQQRWDEYTAKTSASSIKVKDTSNFMVNFAVSMQQLNTVFLVLLGTYLIHADNPADRITMGALIASVILSGRALAPLAQIAGLATRFQQAKLALEGVNNIVERPIERNPERKYITLDHVQGNITFENVSFKYKQEGSAAVSDLRLNIRPGEKVGILGRIGSGKSTMLKLASGLYDAESGNVMLDGVDMRQLDPNFLRNQVMLLSQSPRLFLGTLRENLDLARVDGYSSDQDLLIALKRFGLDRIIRSHPRGLDMPLGEDGLGLSGGQKQIIALARMTLRNPKVVLLDEPTTGLDQATERMALNAVAQWGKDRTLVVVTHRPQVLQIVNRIIVMDNGKVVMDGPRDLVLQKLMQNESNKEEKQLQATKQREAVAAAN